MKFTNPLSETLGLRSSPARCLRNGTAIDPKNLGKILRDRNKLRMGSRSSHLLDRPSLRCCTLAWGLIVTWFVASAAGQDMPVLANPRELAGFGEQEIQSLREQPNPQPGDERLFRLFYRLEQIPNRLLQRATDREDGSEWTLEELALRGSRYEFWPVKLTGRVQRVEAWASPSVYSEDFPQYFRCEWTDATGRVGTLYTDRVPRTWPNAAQLNEPVVIHGFYWGMTTPRSADLPAPTVAGRLQWYPDNASAFPQTPGQLRLSEAGVDFTHGELLRKLERQPLRPAERQCFVELLEAVRNLAPQAATWTAKLPIPTTEAESLVELLRQPEGRWGDYLVLEGRVTQITPILWDASAKFSEGRPPDYYQIQMSIPLRGKQVALEGAAGEAPLVFQNQFPVTLIVPGESQVGLPAVGDLGRVYGYFYRFWAYDSRFSQRADFKWGQISPLLFVDYWQPLQKPEKFSWDFLFPVVLIGLLGFCGLMAWFLPLRKKSRRRSDVSPLKIEEPTL